MSSFRGLVGPPLLVAALGAALLSGCGDGGEVDGGAAEATASAAVLAKVNANCRQLRREAVELGRTALGPDTDLEEAATQNIIKPSIPLLERFALRQQRLAKGSGDQQLELYARLFEPVIVLTQERLRAGEEEGDAVGSAARGFEIMLETTVDEQRQAAGEAGAADCAIDFEKVLTRALRG